MVDELSKEKRIETIAPYLISVLFIFLLSIFLLSSLSRDFLKTLVRMGIPSPNKQTFSLEINTENLEPGSVVAYKSYAQDTDKNWGETEVRYFSVESVTDSTSTTTTTIPPPTTCIQEGGACRLDKQCCSELCSSGICHEKLGPNLWYLIAIPVIVVIVLVIVWMKSTKTSERVEEDEFERLKEKWNR